MPKPTTTQPSRSRSRSAHKQKTTSNPPRRRRQATLYDAIAGRISTTGFIPPHPLPPKNKTRDTSSTSLLPLPPEEVLFRRRNAPERYEEDDFYFAHEKLDPQLLPDSDLLKAVHAYTSDFYGAVLGAGERKVSFGSFDETALLALGVLLEEEVGRLVAGTGDLVFVEGGPRGFGEGPRERMKSERGKARAARGRRRSAMEGSEHGDENEELEEDEQESPEKDSSDEGRIRKRRRLAVEESGSGSSRDESGNDSLRESSESVES
ncbi:MAG: hypothetical protein Q9184_005746 [Pyrenodesmia sp. 2 TL-2023]